MSVKEKIESYNKRKIRVRAKLFGSALRPRLSVFRSQKYVYGQIINDEIGKTLVAITIKDLDSKMKDSKANKTDASKILGMKLAEKAKEMKIDKVVFDRGGYAYHGRVKAFAEGAREGGLNF